MVDYLIQVETSATALRDAGEVISDPLLIVMVLKGLPSEYNTFATVIVQREKQMTFNIFKSTLRSHEESANSLDVKTVDSKENIMVTNPKFAGNCFKCGENGHKSPECWSKTATVKTTSSEHTFAFMSKDKYSE